MTVSPREIVANICLTALTLFAVVFGYLGIVYVIDKAVPDAEAVTVRRGGMPLDAVTYDPPVWLEGCTCARKVVDRVTGDSWWVLKMGEGIYTEYIVLPAGRS